MVVEESNRSSMVDDGIRLALIGVVVGMGLFTCGVFGVGVLIGRAWGQSG